MTEDLLMGVLDNRVAGLQLPRVVIALLRLAQLEPAGLEAKAPALARKMYARTMTQASPELLGALLEAGVSPNLRDDSGRTALMIAAGWGLGPAVETLLQHGADPAIRDNQGRTASDIAAATGRSTLAQRLAVDPPGAPSDPESSGAPRPEARPKDGRTPLHHAALVRGDALQQLLAQGADVHTVDTEGRTPLHNACQVDLDHVRRLLAAGADPNAKDAEGRTPLHYAVGLANGYGSAPLIEAGAHLNAQDARGHAPLHYAVQLNKRERATELLAAGADPRCADLDGETPFDHLDPSLGTGFVDALWLADAQQHGPDRLAQHLKTLIDAGLYLRIRMVLNPAQVTSHFSAVAHRGSLPLGEWAALADELSVYCAARGSWPSLHALQVSGLPVTLPEAMRGRNWSRQELYDSPPGEAPLALLQAAVEGGRGVPLLLRLDPPGCAPALDAALFALSSHLPSPSGERDEASAQALSAALLALVDSGADLEARNGDVAERLHASLHLPRNEADEMLWDDERELSKRYLGLPGIAAGLTRPVHFTPLLQAAESCGPLLPTLLAVGADRRAADRFGRNALHLASAGTATRAEAAVTALLAAGFAVDERDAHGWRALTRASHPRVAAILLEHGASPTLDADERRLLGPESARSVEQLIARAGTR